MNENEKKILLEKYMEMPEKELTDMLMEPECDYREGIFPLLLEAAKSRGLGIEKREIIDKASSLQQEIKEKIAAQPLTPKQKKMFTILPGLAFWYSAFAPKEWKERQKEANRCQWIGTRNYLLLALICVIIFSNTPPTSDEITLIFVITLMTIGISIYLYRQRRKCQKLSERGHR